MYTYKAFGLNIASEIYFDELSPFTIDQPDLIIKKGVTPDMIEGIVVERPNSKIGNDSFLIRIPEIATYYVEKGEQIIFDANESVPIEIIKLYLLGTCMGAVLYQRRILPLHGSCININNSGVLITGRSGAGKSTISSVIYNRGHKMITDDVAAVGINGENLLVVNPSFPGQKLWEDAISRLGQYENKKPLNRILNNMNKYSISSEAYFCSTPVPLKVIIEVIPDEVDEIIVEEIKGPDKLSIVMQNAYRRFIPVDMGIKAWFFMQSTAVSNQVKVYRIKRPNKKHLESEIADLIMERIK